MNKDVGIYCFCIHTNHYLGYCFQIYIFVPPLSSLTYIISITVIVIGGSSLVVLLNARFTTLPKADLFFLIFNINIGKYKKKKNLPTHLFICLSISSLCYTQLWIETHLDMKAPLSQRIRAASGNSSSGL